MFRYCGSQVHRHPIGFAFLRELCVLCGNNALALELDVLEAQKVGWVCCLWPLNDSINGGHEKIAHPCISHDRVNRYYSITGTERVCAHP